MSKGNRSDVPYPFTQTYAQHAGGLWYSVRRNTVKIMRGDTEHVASQLSVPSVAEQSILTLAFRHIDQSRMCATSRLKREFTFRIHYTVMQKKRWYLKKTSAWTTL